MEFVPLVSVVIEDEDGKVLFVLEKKKKNFDKLNLPGGHLEFGESITDGAVREAKEEVSVDVELTGLVGVYTGVKREKNLQYFHYVFSANVLSGTPEANPAEVKGIAWHARDEIYRLDKTRLVSPDKLKMVLEASAKDALGSMDLFNDLPVQS